MKQHPTDSAPSVGNPGREPREIGTGAGGPEDPWARDLAALRTLTARDLPDVHDLTSDLRRRRVAAGRDMGELRRKLMSALVLARRRPALAAALTGVALVIAMLVVPVSYERVSGHDVALTLIGTGIRAADLRSVAGDLRARLGSDGVRVEEMERGSTSWVLRTTSSNRSRAEVERLAGAYARELVGKGYSAGLRVAPHRERVRYPVVAYAWDQIIRISVDGKSASELESEIRQRLAEAGVPDAQVSVTDRPEGGREISLNVERQRFGDVTTPEPEVPQVELTKGGAPLTGGFTVKVKKLKKDGGPITLVVEVGSGGKTATAEVPGSDSMSDGDLANAIVTQLRQAGLNVRVSVRNGEIKIDPVE